MQRRRGKPNPYCISVFLIPSVAVQKHKQSVQSLAHLFHSKSYLQVLAWYIASIAVSMKWAAFKKALIIDHIALVAPLTLFLSVTSTLESTNVIVRSFESFEIPKLKLCNGLKLKRDMSLTTLLLQWNVNPPEMTPMNQETITSMQLQSNCFTGTSSIGYSRCWWR